MAETRLAVGRWPESSHHIIGEAISFFWQSQEIRVHPSVAVFIVQDGDGVLAGWQGAEFHGSLTIPDFQFLFVKSLFRLIRVALPFFEQADKHMSPVISKLGNLNTDTLILPGAE